MPRSPQKQPADHVAPCPPVWFDRPADVLAPALIGAVISRHVAGRLRRARITEVEAYLGPRDLASHASHGKTARTHVMFGDPGTAYVYFIYGMHWMFNIVAGPAGSAHAVLLRAAAPLDDWRADLAGPARLARAFNITGRQNNRTLADAGIFISVDPKWRPRIVRTPRIGIDYARHWKRRLLRFVDVAEVYRPTRS